MHGIVVQIPGMRVEGRSLPTQGVNHPGMTVPHRGDIVVAIQVSLATGIVQPYTFATHQVHGFLIEQVISGTHRLFATIQQFRIIHDIS